MLSITAAFATAALIASAICILLICVSTQLAVAGRADLSIEVYRCTLYQSCPVHLTRKSSSVISGITIKVNGVVFGVMLPLLTLVISTVVLLAIMLALLAIDLLVAAGFGASYSLIT